MKGNRRYIAALALACLVAPFGTGTIFVKGMVPAAQRESHFPAFSVGELVVRVLILLTGLGAWLG